MNDVEAYIESRLPLEEISIECGRERKASSALPPLQYLHVWWARRPLTASRAAVLASLLPSSVTQDEFLRLLGIKGDPVSSQKASKEAQKNAKRLDRNPFDYPRAFTVSPTSAELDRVRQLFHETWHDEQPLVLDPMAGGGSIPLEALRSGARTIAGEYNPVAYVILKATLEFPLRFGKQLADEILKWASWISERVRNDLREFFPSDDSEVVLDYIWARTVRCPSCNLLVPLAPNWWLSRQKGKKVGVAVKLVVPDRREGDVVRFTIIDVRDNTSLDPSRGTASEGKASCPREKCGTTIADDYIKREAQQGRMGHQLYAVVIKRKSGPKKWEKTYRLPSSEDVKAYEKAVQLVKKGDFPGSQLVPREHVPQGLKTREPLNYGMLTWDQFFNARQLLSHAAYLHYILLAKEEFLKYYGKNEKEKAVAIATYLAFILDKCLDRNAVLSVWIPTYQRVVHVFDRHDFSFNWSYAEMNMIEQRVGGFDWATEQVRKAYVGLCNLLANVNSSQVQVSLGTSLDMSYVMEPVDAVVVDPPYYANVMYGELSDFFYVWMKRILSDLHKGFETPVVDKDGEAVANPARFKGLGVSAEEKAKEDYRLKMALTFKQVHRVLKPHGILVVMFTHKTTDAWDTLATALIDAGFQIKRSWPIRTESELSLHIAKKNSAKSTILLVARKREAASKRGWWEQDVYPEIVKAAEESSAEFEKRGIEGVDLYISTFGPALEIFSRYLEVKSMTGKVIQPEEALDVARKVVTNGTFQKLVPGGATGIDEATKFYILAMHFYRARLFPFDEARKLAISVGTDPAVLRDKQHVIRKKSEDVVVLDAAEREHSGYIDLEKPKDKPLIDAIHLVQLALQRGGMKQYQALTDQLKLDTNPDFRVALQALSEALPDADPEKRALAPLLLQAPELRAKGSRLEDYSTLGK